VAVAKKNPEYLRRGEKVYAAEDLPGVPMDTPGKVIVSVGLTWIRYRVRFANGVEIGSLDRAQIARDGERTPV